MRSSLQRIEDLGAADQCADRVVREFLLAQGGRLECVVSRDGTVFAVPGALKRRVSRALLRCVEERLGRAALVDVTPTQLRRWWAATRPRSGSEQADARKKSNKTVEYVFGAAIDRRASDVYLDIGREEAVLSFRTFGFVKRFESFPREAALELARAIWALGENAQFQPAGVCDVAFDFAHRGRQYRIRGNSMKEVRGNAVVCRIRDPFFLLPLADCGYSAAQVNQIERICRCPGGLVLITGETNSGKSTTLASLMAAMPPTERTMEVADPVEVHMPHVAHIEVEHYGEGAAEQREKVQAGMVRQNPDNLVLGEIRDQVTAAYAQNMALQGKRVLSTLHTQSCVSAIPRLSGLGVSQSLLGTRAFLAGIVNQNLVPVGCPRCSQNVHPDPDADRRYRRMFGQGVRFINRQGCDACTDGAAGETLVAEVYPLWLDRTGVAHALIADGKLGELERYMRDDGPSRGGLTKHRHAAEKIRAGAIDPEHTERIIGEFGAEDLDRDDIQVVELRP